MDVPWPTQEATLPLDSPAVALSVDRRDPRQVIASLAQGPPVLLDFATGSMTTLPTVTAGGRQRKGLPAPLKAHPRLKFPYACLPVAARICTRSSFRIVRPAPLCGMYYTITQEFSITSHDCKSGQRAVL